MSTLYLDRKGLELQAESSTLVIRCDGVLVRRVPLRLLERVVVRGHTALDTRLLQQLGEAGISFVTLSPRYGRRVSMAVGPLHQDCRIRLNQWRLFSDPDYALPALRSIMIAKSREQLKTIEWLNRPEHSLPAKRVKEALNGAIGQFEVATDADAIRGMEGAAARAYFRALADIAPDSLGFSGRNRRPPKDPLNACMSLGYTLIHCEAVRELYAVGLDPYCGFFHEPVHGRESLACDLCEPLRPYWDRALMQLFRQQTLSAQDFKTSGNGCILGKSGRARFYTVHRGLAGMSPIEKRCEAGCFGL